MKGLLKYPLYKRTTPSNVKEAAGYLEEDSVVELAEMVSGDELDGISLWYRSSDGFFYWGGGLDILPGDPPLVWNGLSEQQQLSVLNSMVNDEGYRIELTAKKAVGHAIGYKNDDSALGLALIIYVENKDATGPLTKTVSYKNIHDIPLDVKETKKIIHNHPQSFKPDKALPMQMGGSISRLEGPGFGTRGLVLKKEGRAYLLTCFHVLLDHIHPETKYPYARSLPCTAEYPSPLQNPYNVKSRKVTVSQGWYNNRRDFALVELGNANDVVNAFNNRLFRGFHTSGTLKGLLNQQVYTAGAVSILKSGKVLETKGSITINQTGMRFDNVIVTEKMSVPGDSGAPVIDSADKVVGIIIASDELYRSYVLPVHGLAVLEGYTF